MDLGSYDGADQYRDHLRRNFVSRSVDDDGSVTTASATEQTGPAAPRQPGATALSRAAHLLRRAVRRSSTR